MRVHPVAPRKRNIVFRCDAAAAAGQKKLRRLPHIFSKVLELPLPFDAHVAVSEDPTCLRFAASAEGFFFSGPGVRAHAIEIHPGVMKVVVRDSVEFAEEEMDLELDRWRFRLPNGTQPRLATAEYVDGELVVTVPKGLDEEDGEPDGPDGVGIGQMILVQ